MILLGGFDHLFPDEHLPPQNFPLWILLPFFGKILHHETHQTHEQNKFLKSLIFGQLAYSVGYTLFLIFSFSSLPQ